MGQSLTLFPLPPPWGLLNATPMQPRYTPPSSAGGLTDPARTHAGAGGDNRAPAATAPPRPPAPAGRRGLRGLGFRIGLGSQAD